MGQALADCVWPARAILGEGPLWSSRDRALYWVDIRSPALHRYAPDDGARHSWPMPQTLGWVIERRDRSGFIAGFKAGFAELDLDPPAIRPIGDPEPHLPRNRRNDAKADSKGRIWAGSMDEDEQIDSGGLWRLDPDLSWSLMDVGYQVANGPAFSPDGSILYHTDSAKRVIYRFELDPTGNLHDRRVHIQFEEAWGYPDGMTTDAEGGLWVAHWDGARVSRFSPDGVLDRWIDLPVSRPTSCAFGGEDLDRLFITSASIGREDEALAGGLFEVDPAARGLPAEMFAG